MIWGVFLALLAVLALLGRTRLGVRGEYTPRSAGLWLRVGGLRWQLYPRKERTKKRTAEPAAKPAKAKGEDIPYQLEVMEGHTGTNGWHMQVSREGIPTSVVSLPLKYMHTPIEVLESGDMEAVARLLAAFTEKLGEEAEGLC